MPPADLEIRPAVPAEAGLLADLGARTFRDTYAPLGSEDAEIEAYVDEHFREPVMAEHLRDPRSSLLLAFLDGEPVGYVHLREGPPPQCVSDPQAIELSRIYLDQAVLGRGLGTQLLEAALDEAERRDARTMWLGVWDENSRAHLFYKARGFREVGTHDFWFGGRVYPDVVLERPVRLPAPRPARAEAPR